jgi:hypothetical protein
LIVGASIQCRPIKIAVGAQNQAAARIGPEPGSVGARE